jgi:hypothetical protein
VSAPAKEFHLIPDALAGTGEAPRPEPIRVPAGVSYLAVTEGRPQVSDRPGAAAVALEAVSAFGQDRLLAVAPARGQARCNGQPLPRVALLGVRDQLRFGDTLLHVTLFHRPHVGPPPADTLGRECPLCRVALVGGTTVYVCSHCGTALHCEGEERLADERLECARLASACPACDRPVVLSAGYAYYPEVHGD